MKKTLFFVARFLRGLRADGRFPHCHIEELGRRGPRHVCDAKVRCSDDKEALGDRMEVASPGHERVVLGGRGSYASRIRECVRAGLGHISQGRAGPVPRPGHDQISLVSGEVYARGG